jgi:hypothetical protein
MGRRQAGNGSTVGDPQPSIDRKVCQAQRLDLLLLLLLEFCVVL